MTKIARFTGDLQAFGSAATGTERTVFGDVAQSDTLDANINADFLAGWENGLDVNDFPPQQYFNAVSFTATQLAAYLHQMGIAEYDAVQEYHIGSLANVLGLIYKSLTNANIGNAVTDTANWQLIAGFVSKISITGTYDGSLTAAIADIGANEKTLLLDGLVTLTQADVVPENITLEKTREGKFTAAFILTINGSMTGDLNSPWFDSSVTVVSAQPVYTSQFGNDAAAVEKAASSASHIIITSGTYDETEIDDNNVTLEMEPGVTFQVPGGTVSSPDVTGPAALLLSGDNITINGNFGIDGNVATNDASNFPTTERVGALSVTGANCKINGKVTITDAYHIGLQVDGGGTSGNEIDGFELDSIEIINSFEIAVLLWSMENWRINTIKVRTGVDSINSRVRIGTQSGDSSVNTIGVIGNIDTDESITVEDRTTQLQIDSVKAVAFKIEGGVTTHHIQIPEISISGEVSGSSYFGFGLNGCTDVQIGDVAVVDYNSDIEAVSIDDVVDCRINSVYVSGTKTNVFDMRIAGFDNLTIGSITLVDPVGTGDGLNFDEDVSLQPQDGLYIGSIHSEGHTTLDINHETGYEDFHVNHVNEDAKGSNGFLVARSFPNGLVARGVFTVDSGTGAVTITGDFNITSAVEGAPGAHTIVFTNSISDNTISIPHLTVFDAGTVVTAKVTSFTTASMIVRFLDATGTEVRVDKFYLEVFGQ